MFESVARFVDLSSCSTRSARMMLERRERQWGLPITQDEYTRVRAYKILDLEELDRLNEDRFPPKPL